MYRITRVVTRNSNDRNPIKSHLANIDCDQAELGRTVLFALRQLAKSENANYKLVGADTRVSYHVSVVTSEPIDSFITKVEGIIKSNVSKVNGDIRTLNKLTIKRNKKDCKVANANCIAELNLKDYSIVNVFQQNYLALDNVIVVEGEERVQEKQLVAHNLATPTIGGVIDNSAMKRR